MHQSRFWPGPAVEAHNVTRPPSWLGRGTPFPHSSSTLFASRSRSLGPLVGLPVFLATPLQRGAEPPLTILCLRVCVYYCYSASRLLVTLAYGIRLSQLSVQAAPIVKAIQCMTAAFIIGYTYTRPTRLTECCIASA